MLLAQRLDEVHFKGTILPIEQTFWREFGCIPVSWEPLYAPVNIEKHPYGSYFATEIEIPTAQAQFGEFFLTSRGWSLLIRTSYIAHMESRIKKPLCRNCYLTSKQ